MIKIDTGTVLLGMNGKPLLIEDKEQTVGEFVSEALAMDRTNPSKGWTLGKKFATEKLVELKAEDIVYIKEAFKELKVSAVFGGQVIELIEGPNKE